MDSFLAVWMKENTFGIPKSIYFNLEFDKLLQFNIFF